jgi:hypothetical protein
MRRAIHLASLSFVLTVLASHVQAEMAKPLRAANDKNINELIDSIFNKCGEEWGFFRGRLSTGIVWISSQADSS